MAIAEIFTHLIELTANVTEADTTALYAVDPEDGALVLQEHLTLSSNFIPEVRIPFGESLIGKVAESGKPVVMDHFDADPRTLKIFKKNEELKCFLAVPATHRHLEGVLVLASKRNYTFPPKLQKIVSGFAQQMAWHLAQEKDPPGGRHPGWPSIRKMNQFSRRIAEAGNRESLAERLIQMPPDILPCDALAVVWFNGHGQGVIENQRGFHQELGKLRVVLGQGLVGTCAQERAPLLTKIRDPREVTLFAGTEKPERLKAVAAVPITRKQSLMGVLLCGSQRSDGLTRSDLDKLSLIASSAASSLFCADTRTRSDHDKNLDPVTRVFNYRFLSERHEALAERIFKSGQPVYFLTVQLTNLPDIYQAYGSRRGDRLLRQIAAGFSKMVPPPKYLFKYFENSFVLLLLQKDEASVFALETRLKNLFKHKPIYVDGIPMKLKTHWGLSVFPDDGAHLLDLISLSWARSAQTPYPKALP